MNPRIFTRMSAIPIILTMFLLILVPTISISSASVSYFEISPENPVKGDIVKIEGKADTPSEPVPITLSFEKDLSVVDGKYEWRLSSVEIPEGDNRFIVTATNVKRLNVALKIIIWITKSADAENGIAKISQSNVPAGTRDAKISGKSESDSNEVNIKVEAEAFLNADATGHFEYEYDTSSIPAGEFKVTVGGITKKVELTPSSSGGDGGEGRSGSVAPETTPTPTPALNTTITGNVTENETTTPTPASTTTAPQTTPIKTETDDKTPGPTPENKTNQSEPPQKTTKPSGIPGFGFEAIGCIAIAALIMVIMKNKRAVHSEG